jgi:membrane peptidoglycan carboxypeptidase
VNSAVTGPTIAIRPKPKSQQRSRPRTIVGWTIVGVFWLLVGLFLLGYATTKVPPPSSFATAQTSIFTFDDGKTELGRVGTLNRIDVALSQVPLGVRHAVLAAEDRNYYSEPGVSVHGIARALAANVRGGGISQGGSTITQQYAKNAFLTQNRTITRKIREIFIAIKLDRTTSKDQILQDYLNTIYFGRGAYGISTAAQAYFGKPVASLDNAQGALLAAAIQAPSRYDPLKHPAAAQARWRYVLDGMVSKKWLAPSEADALRFPAVRPPSTRDLLGGPNGYLVAAVSAELDAHGFDDDRLARSGYRVVTTINRKLQSAAVTAVQDRLGKRPEPVGALAAVRPDSGRIVAMYGGRDYTGTQPAASINLATNRRPPGSSFKPYTLATALSEDVSLRTDYRGTSPLVVDGWDPSKGNVVRNDSGEQCPRCDLIRSTALSVNTVFAQLVLQVGPEKVAALAKAAGVSAPLAGSGGFVPPSITLGTKNVSPLDQASGFATFAAGGEHMAPYLVAKVLDSAGRAAYTAKPARTRAFSSEVAADATYAMTKVIRYGTGTRARLHDGRPVAGKTGTTTNSTDAWFVGFTPQLSAAVWLGNVDNAPLTNVPGYSGGVYGGQLPAEIWKGFMTAAMDGVPVQDFPAPAFGGSTASGLPPPPPTPTSSPSSSLSSSPPLSPPPRTPASSSARPTTSPSTRSPASHSPSAAHSPTAARIATAAGGPPAARSASPPATPTPPPP